MQYNLPLPRQTTGQNYAKLLLCFFIYPRLSHEIHLQMNQTLQRSVFWGISHANGNTKTLSEETSVAKDLVLVILKP